MQLREPKQDGYEEGDMKQCLACNGRGVVLANLRSFEFGPGFIQFMSAGCQVVWNEDGSVYHEIVCIVCGGTGECADRLEGREDVPR